MSQQPPGERANSRGGDTHRWRERKEWMISVRSLGLEQGRALSHLAKHTEQMFAREVKDTVTRTLQSSVREQRSLRHGHGKGLQDPHRKSPLRMSKVRLRVDEKAVAKPRPASSGFSERRSDRQARIGDLSQNLPLTFISRREAPSLLQESVSSEPSRALEQYAIYAREQPNVRYHLPYTESFVESHRASSVPLSAAETGLEGSTCDESLRADMDFGDIAARLSSTLTLTIPTARRAPVPSYDPKAVIDYLTFSSPSPRTPKLRRI